jgi:hypothetical protein
MTANLMHDFFYVIYSRLCWEGQLQGKTRNDIA